MYTAETSSSRGRGRRCKAEGGVGGTPVGDIKPKSHLMLIKDSEACLTHIFSLYYSTQVTFFFQMFCMYRASLFLIWIRMNWKVSHISKWVKVSAHLLVPNGKTAEMNGASSADQVLLWGVSLLHSLIIVGSCLLMTQSSSTENHYPSCVMEIANVLCKRGSSKHRFVL